MKHLFIAEYVSENALFCPLVSSLSRQIHTDWHCLLIYSGESDDELTQQIEFIEDQRFTVAQINVDTDGLSDYEIWTTADATMRRQAVCWAKENIKPDLITHCDTETYYASGFSQSVLDQFEYVDESLQAVFVGHSSERLQNYAVTFDRFENETPYDVLDSRSLTVRADLAYKMGFPVEYGAEGIEYVKLALAHSGEQNFCINKVMVMV